MPAARINKVQVAGSGTPGTGPGDVPGPEIGGGSCAWSIGASPVKDRSAMEKSLPVPRVFRSNSRRSAEVSAPEFQVTTYSTHFPTRSPASLPSERGAPAGLPSIMSSSEAVFLPVFDAAHRVKV